MIRVVLVHTWYICTYASEGVCERAYAYSCILCSCPYFVGILYRMLGSRAGSCGDAFMRLIFKIFPVNNKQRKKENKMKERRNRGV